MPAIIDLHTTDINIGDALCDFAGEIAGGPLPTGEEISFTGDVDGPGPGLELSADAAAGFGIGDSV